MKVLFEEGRGFGGPYGFFGTQIFLFFFIVKRHFDGLIRARTKIT